MEDGKKRLNMSLDDIIRSEGPAHAQGERRPFNPRGRGRGGGFGHSSRQNGFNNAPYDDSERRRPPVLRRAGMRGGFVHGSSGYDAPPPMPMNGYGPVHGRHRPPPPVLQHRRPVPKREPIEQAMLHTKIQTDQDTGDLVVRLYETNVVSINSMSGHTVLTSGGYRTDETFALISEALKPLGLKLTQSPSDEKSWNVSNGRSFLMPFTDDMVLRMPPGPAAASISARASIVSQHMEQAKFSTLARFRAKEQGEDSAGPPQAPQEPVHVVNPFGQAQYQQQAHQGQFEQQYQHQYQQPFRSQPPITGQQGWNPRPY